MSDVQVSPAPPVTISASALRLVLFGMPHAGKSSLLGALLQAAQTQEHALHGRLTDLSLGLAELHRRLYEDQPRITPEEIVGYPIVFEPFAAKATGQTSGKIQAELIDCSGLVANELLARERTLETSSEERTLAQSILEADALFLVVDASSPASQLEADFAQFARFLELVERKRGRRKDVGGVPVFLVLTKCDLLAQPTDSPASWIEQIEERKRQVAQRFDEFLAHVRTREAPRFGRIHLQLWATAVKRPALSTSPEKPREPYGVAELFRQGLGAARSYRNAQRRAGRRLLTTVASMVGILALLLIAGALLVFLWEKPGPLEARVARYRSRETSLTPAAAHRNAKAKIDELSGFVRDPAFERLPDSARDYVSNQLHELQAYEAFTSKLGQITDPADATSMSQLDQIEASLKQLSIPEEYRVDWSQTELGRRYTDWIDDVAALRGAVLKVEGWYQKLARDGQQVLDNINGPNLPARARKVLEESKTPPFPENDNERPISGSRRLTYANVFSFNNVRAARSKWEEEIKKKLEPYAKFDH
jgi:GTPase SAR1 family protein